MTQENISTTRTAIKYGLYVGGASVVLYFLFYVLGLHKSPVTSVSNIVLIAGIIYALREYKLMNDGYLSFGQGLGIGTMLSVITGFLVGMFIMIYLSFNPLILEQYLQEVIQTNESFGESLGLSDEEIDQQNELSKSMIKPPFYFLVYLITYLLFGFIFTLVIAAVQRKNRDIFDD